MSTINTDDNGFKTLDPAPTAAGAGVVQDNTNLTSAFVTSLTASIATNTSGVAANLAAILTNDIDIAANLAAIQSNDTDILALQNAVTGISVTNYGTAGDGATDDRTALLSANDAADAAGAVLLVPPGTYLAGSGLTFTVPVVFIGGVLKTDSGVTATLNLPYTNLTGEACFDTADATGTIVLAATNPQTSVSSEDWSQADLGDRVNAAVATLPTRGGEIRLPMNAEVEYAETIVLGRSGLRLVGDHQPTNESEGTATLSLGTHITYTGTGNAISVSVNDGDTYRGFAFKGILLECTNSSCAGGIVFLGHAYQTLFENLSVEGPGSGVGDFVGIDIISATQPVSNTQIGRWVKLRRCDIGLRMDSVHSLHFSDLQCVFCRIGVQMYNNACYGNTFSAPWMEACNIGFDIQTGRGTTILGGYGEATASGDLYLAAGQNSGNWCRGLTVIGPHLNGGPADYSIQLTRCANFALIGGHARNQGVAVIENLTPGQVEHGNHYVAGLESVDVPIWSSTTGVTSFENRQGHINYPNVPPCKATLTFDEDDSPVTVTLANSPAIYVLDDAPGAGAAAGCTFNLPVAIPGLEYIFHLRVAEVAIIDPNGTETIALPSTRVQGGAGKYITADAYSEWVHLKCETAGQWECLGFGGTWTAEA